MSKLLLKRRRPVGKGPVRLPQEFLSIASFNLFLLFIFGSCMYTNNISFFFLFKKVNKHKNHEQQTYTISDIIGLTAEQRRRRSLSGSNQHLFDQVNNIHATQCPRPRTSDIAVMILWL